MILPAPPCTLRHGRIIPRVVDGSHAAVNSSRIDHTDMSGIEMRGFGGLISIRLGSLDNARMVLESVRLVALAESLGGVETLISHPATMTHGSVPAQRRQQIGITDDLVRISVGIEDIEDLIADMSQALDRVPAS